MREIKFRAWEKNLKQIIPVHNIDFEARMINTGGPWRHFGEIELMQYTGLHDKNGREIYEGDILYDSGEYYSPVIWSKEYAGWFIQTYDGPEPLYEQGNVIICGNIHDNPELLKEDQNVK